MTDESESETLKLTVETWELLLKVNYTVNSNTRFIPDIALYRLPDFWNIADGNGDCEDYAVTKRRLLLKEGIPGRFLWLATCYTEGPKRQITEQGRTFWLPGLRGRGGYHAVLLVDTDKGTLVLDNRFNYVEPWDGSGVGLVLEADPGEEFRGSRRERRFGSRGFGQDGREVGFFAGYRWDWVCRNGEWEKVG